MKKQMRALVLAAGVSAASWVGMGSCAYLMDARPSVDWFTKGVIYQVQPRAFSEEGTLKAIEAKLGYLKDLGVTIVYLVPVMQMDEDMDRAFWSPRQIKSGFGNPKNQYRLKDYYHVDSEYGTDEDLKSLVAAAHKMGMKVILDLVYFHAGPTANVWKEHPEFTFWNEDGTIAKGAWRFPRFNFNVKGTREWLWDNMVGLIREYDVDGYRCDVGDGVPLGFWCEGIRRMKEVKADSILLCEGYDEKDQEDAFDADYGWFPCEGVLTGMESADFIRGAWNGREQRSTKGARFVNHYENHDIATDKRPRREKAWGSAAVEQVLVWMFTIDGVPMLFTGNEMADADEKHSMFGKTPMDWSQLEREPGKARHEFVKRLAAMRREHAAFTDLNGRAGLAWLDVTATNSATAFVRTAKDGERILVVQNWTNKDVATDVSFKAPPDVWPDWVIAERVDRSIKGTLAEKPLLSRAAEKTGAQSFKLGPYGFAIYPVNKK